jgi:hypothetical protein
VSPKILEHSDLLKDWSDCTMFQLTKCRRSDEPHFRFYTSLPEDLHTAINMTKRKYKKSNEEDGDLHLVISHRKRRSLNVNKQERMSLGLGVLVPCYDGECEYACVKGTPPVGSCTGHKFVNGAFYEMVSHTDVAVTVRDTLNEDAFECTPDVLSKHTQLAHAVVYNRAQGLTIKDKTVVLHSLGSSFFRREHLYVGLSRVTSGSDIRIAS